MATIKSKAALQAVKTSTHKINNADWQDFVESAVLKLSSTGYANPAMLGSGTASSVTYLRGDGVWAEVEAGTTLDVSAFIETLLDDSDAATARATLGLGTISTLDSSLFVVKTSTVADGASAVAHVLDTSTAYVTAGAKLLSLRNATVEKFSVGYDGALSIPVGAPYQMGGNNVLIYSGGVVRLSDLGGGLAFRVGSIDSLALNPLGAVTLTQTWNNALTTFKAFTIDVTDTASASGSLLMDLRTGGYSMATITKGGYLTLKGDAGANYISMGADTGNSGVAYIVAGSEIRFYVSNYSDGFVAYTPSAGVIGFKGAYNYNSGVAASFLLAGGANDTTPGNLYLRGGYSTTPSVCGVVKIQSADGLTDYVTVTNTGKVGIGTTSPGAKLDVSNGTLRASNDDASVGYLSMRRVGNAGYANGQYRGILESSGNDYGMDFVALYGGASTTQSFRFFANGTTQLASLTHGGVLSLHQTKMVVGHQDSLLLGINWSFNNTNYDLLTLGTTGAIFKQLAGVNTLTISPGYNNADTLITSSGKIKFVFGSGSDVVFDDYNAEILLRGGSGQVCHSGADFQFISVSGNVRLYSAGGMTTVATDWNSGATTFTAFKVNVTDTASASGSLLMDLQVGGTSLFRFRKDGLATLSTIIVPGLAGFGANLDGTIRVFVSGMGATSDTTALYVTNVNGVCSLACKDSTRVGVRTYSPEADFHAVGQATGTQFLLGYQSSTDSYLDTAGDLHLRTTSSFTERVILKSDGKVGIGTTSPVTRLDVAGDIRANPTGFLLDSGLGYSLGGMSNPAVQVVRFGGQNVTELQFWTGYSYTNLSIDGVAGGQMTLAPVWNNALTTFTGLKVNVTDTASASASLLMDLQVDAASKFRVSKDGGIVVTARAALATDLFLSNQIVLLGYANDGSAFAGHALAAGYGNNADGAYFASAFLFTSNGNYPATTCLTTDAAGILAQRNGTNAQEFRVYGSTAIGYLAMRHTGSYAQVEALAKDLYLSGAQVIFSSSIFPYTSALYDLGLTGNRFRAAYLGGNTVTASAPVLNLTQTWNNGAVQFYGILANFTDTASASGSLLLDLQVGGASKFSVNKAGQTLIPVGSLGAPSLAIGSPTVGIYKSGHSWVFTNGDSSGTDGIWINPSGSSISLVAAANTWFHAINYVVGVRGDSGATGRFGWSFSLSDLVSGVQGTSLYSPSAGIVEQRNGTNAQEFRVYGTTTGSKYASLSHDSVSTAIFKNTTGNTRLDAYGWTFEIDGNNGNVLPHNSGSMALGTASRRFSYYYGGGNTVTSSTPLLNLTQTWNSGGVTFTGVLANFTDTASASGSLLMDLQVGGIPLFSVRKDGLCSSGVGFAAPSFTAYTNAVIANATYLTSFGPQLGAGVALHWADAGGLGSTSDLFLYRDAAGVLAQRNGTNAQEFRVYKTYTDASNYERLTTKMSGSYGYVWTEQAGTGVARGLVVGTTGDAGVFLMVNGGTVAQLDGTGFHPGAGSGSGSFALGYDNLRWKRAYLGGSEIAASTPVIDITQTWNNGAVDFIGILADFTLTAWGAASLLMDLRVAGTTKFNVNYAGQVTLAAGQGLHFTSRGYILPTNDGVLALYNEALTGFTRLCFGGTSASEPALARNGVYIEAVLADGGGGYANFRTNHLAILGTLDHGGAAVGFYGVTPIARAVLATGAAHTVDDVITALQNLGLVKQS